MLKLLYITFIIAVVVGVFYLVNSPSVALFDINYLTQSIVGKTMAFNWILPIDTAWLMVFTIIIVESAFALINFYLFGAKFIAKA